MHVGLGTRSLGFRVHMLLCTIEEEACGADSRQKTT